MNTNGKCEFADPGTKGFFIHVDSHPFAVNDLLSDKGA
jgi:hypothetical protein